ncbi:MAG: M15 family metallopeptidase [Spirochaetaceae bacterium]|jgi:D-alanyl-D-alanine dipeptidase|nr:M15 family metallopeptidase [Spirochaetaceae bacterium]
MNISTSGIPKAGLPQGFVYIDDLIEDCIVDQKYWGTDNFVGCRIDGYDRPLVIMTVEAARGAVKAADILRNRGFLVKFFDAYRPQRAVNHFMRWGADPQDIRRKPIHYPSIDKERVFELGYVAEKSAHTRGTAVDLTLVDKQTHQELDMGTIFDFMDPRSHALAQGLNPQQEQNRTILREAMEKSGFVRYPYEWWHYNLAQEPYPDTYFDFPIR